MAYIRIIATYIIRAILHIFYIFPIKKNRITFNSHMWKQYSCNPKYISEYLNKNYPGEFELIWSFKEPEKFDYLKEQGIKVIKTRSLKYYYYRLTAKVCVCNTTMAAEIPKRKGQYLINTWHGGGGGYKRVDYSNTSEFRARLEMSQMDLFCASSETSLKNTVRIAFKHDGDFFPGTPRNDMLVNNNRQDLKEDVFRFLNIGAGKELLLYAPTYREGSDQRHWSKSYDYGLDYIMLHEAVEKRFGGEWIIAIRFHPRVSEYEIPECDYIVDATKYPDMQELLASVDAFITDYSSSIWDFSFTYKPCFLFCADLSDYIKKRGFNKPIEEWGMPLARTNEELYDNIMCWTEEECRRSMDKHHAENGSFEDGKATERICKLIHDFCNS